MSELVNTVKGSVAKHGEVMVKAVIEDCYDLSINEAKEALKKLIPGQVDDMVIELVISTFAPALKTALLEQVEKISA